MKWVYLTTAPDQVVAEMLSDMLRQEGLNVVVRAGDTTSFLGVSNYPCRLMVDETQFDTAQEMLSETEPVTDEAGEEE